jgi:hypothetical protein
MLSERIPRRQEKFVRFYPGLDVRHFHDVQSGNYSRKPSCPCYNSCLGERGRGEQLLERDSIAPALGTGQFLKRSCHFVSNT